MSKNVDYATKYRDLLRVAVRREMMMPFKGYIATAIAETLKVPEEEITSLLESWVREGVLRIVDFERESRFRPLRQRPTEYKLRDPSGFLYPNK